MAKKIEIKRLRHKRPNYKQALILIILLLLVIFIYSRADEWVTGWLG